MKISIRSGFGSTMHPVGVHDPTASILVDEILSWSHHIIRRIDLPLGTLQLLIGQKTYKDRPRGDPLEIDFTWAMRVLNHASPVLAMDETQVMGQQKVFRKSKGFEEMMALNGEA